MALPSRFKILLLLLHGVAFSVTSNTASNTASWVDVLRIQTSIPNVVAAADAGGVAARLSVLEETMTRKLDSIESMLKRLLAGDGSSDLGNLTLRRDVVTAIGEGRFELAEQRMLQLKNPAAVAEIVCDLVGSSRSNFRVLLNLTQSVSEPSLKSQLLKSLYDEVEQGNRTSTIDLIHLAKALSEDVANPHAGTLLSKLLQRISEGTLSYLLSVLKSTEGRESPKSESKYEHDEGVRALSAGIANWTDVSENVMTGLVSDAMRTIEDYTIFRAVTSHADAWQALVGVDAFIDKVMSRDALVGIVALEIASSLKEIMGRVSFSHVHQERALAAVDKIPECPRKLIFSSTFCILNRHYDAFLIASEYADEKKQRTVRTSLRVDGNTIPKGARWQVKRIDGRLAFQSVDYPNELLQSGVGENGVNWPIAGPVDDDSSAASAWVLHTLRHTCLLRNAATNKFLYASNSNAGSKRLNVVKADGQLDRKVDSDSPLAWQIETC